jgi:hypothetical protein
MDIINLLIWKWNQLIWVLSGRQPVASGRTLARASMVGKPFKAYKPHQTVIGLETYERASASTGGRSMQAPQQNTDSRFERQ